MDKRLKTILCGLAPLAFGSAAILLAAFATKPDSMLWRECLRDLSGLAVILPPWFAAWCGLQNRRDIRPFSFALALFLLPAVLFMFIPGAISSLFFYVIDGNFLGLPLAEWQLRLMDTIELGFAFWVGHRCYAMEDINSYYFLGICRMGLGMVQNFTQHLSGGNTDILAPILGIAALPLLVMQLKTGFEILRGVFTRRG